ncbi:TonB-dependent receptor [Flavobacteriaceae bacterium GSB9]|nr:TonB-dependent receptor [Flavobacteriaceae bacterium GSB9]
MSLLQLFPILESRFDVKFSYTESDVRNVMVNAPETTKSIEEVIQYLNLSTILNFNILNDRYITVSTIDKKITICGSVLSAKDSLPLMGASVVIEDKSKGIIANVEGGFQLSDVAIEAQVVVSFLGYESVVFPAENLMKLNENCKPIFLKEKSEALNQIIISKFLTTGLQKRIDGSTVLNTEQFGVLPGLTEPDVLQSIQALPGVESVNESVSNINVRGGTNDQNLMLWDGIKMYHSGHFFGLISAYNPYLTNKVIVTKNGTPAEFSNGVSSTINMTTKNDVSREFSGGIGANLIHADTNFEIPISKKLSIHISGRRSFTDMFSTPTYSNYFERSFQDSELTTNSDNIEENNRSSNFYFYDYTTKLLYDINNDHKFRANVIGITNNLDYEESYTDNNGEIDSKTSNLEQQNLGFGSSWSAHWGPSFTTYLSAFYSKYNVDATDYRIETDQRLTQANEVLETGLKFKTDLKLSDYLDLFNGYEFSEIGILNQTTVSAPSYEKTKKDVLLNHALFSEMEYRKDKTYLRIGVRGNYFQKFRKFILEPRLNVRQRLSSRFAVKLQGEFKNQSATQIIDFQDDFLGVENRRWILANEKSIPISESKQVSFGVTFNRNNLVIDVEGFYKQVQGVTASNQGFYNNFKYINTSGNYTARGIEFLINKTAKSYSTWLSYTYCVNDYEFKNVTPSVFPNNVDIRHSLSLAFNYNVFEQLEFSFGGIYRTGRPYTKPVAGKETVMDGNRVLVNYDAPNNENLDGFFRLDTSVNYNFNMSNTILATLRAGVINVLDKKNSINRYYEVDPNNTEAVILIDNKSIGLTPNLSFRVHF